MRQKDVEGDAEDGAEEDAEGDTEGDAEVDAEDGVEEDAEDDHKLIKHFFIALLTVFFMFTGFMTSLDIEMKALRKVLMCLLL